MKNHQRRVTMPAFFSRMPSGYAINSTESTANPGAKIAGSLLPRPYVDIVNLLTDQQILGGYRRAIDSALKFNSICS